MAQEEQLYRAHQKLPAELASQPLQVVPVTLCGSCGQPHSRKQRSQPFHCVTHHMGHTYYPSRQYDWELQAYGEEENTVFSSFLLVEGWWALVTLLVPPFWHTRKAARLFQGD